MKSDTKRILSFVFVVGVATWILRNRVAVADGCRVVGLWDRQRALSELIRPAEVAWVPRALGGIAFADQVGAWMRRRFQYKPDKPTRDVWCSPEVTLTRGGGDCDDLAIVGCSVLRAAGFEAVVRTGTMDQGRGPVGHAWVEGCDHNGWFLLEATSGSVHRCHRPSGYEVLT
ncbi:MAG: transglutaminase-like domain-containing protein [Parvibaculum sp.]